MKCRSRFNRTRRLPQRLEELAYAGMAAIPHASNVRVLETSHNDDWVVVEYDWPDDVGYFETTDDVMHPFGLELAKGWLEKPEEPLR